MTADEDFAAVLADLHDKGGRPPCAYDPEMWFGDDADRGAATFLCLACPLLELCRARTAEIRPLPSDGVWAGIDLSIASHRRDAAAQARRRAAHRTAMPHPTAPTRRRQENHR